jgi:hypothetical protein
MELHLERTATIEQIKPQSGIGEDLRLDYRNMLEVCSENRIGANSRKTCDNSTNYFKDLINEKVRSTYGKSKKGG